MKRAPNARWTRIFGLAGLLTLLRRVRRRADAKELAIESREPAVQHAGAQCRRYLRYVLSRCVRGRIRQSQCGEALGVSVEAVKNNIRALSDSAADPSSDPRIDDIASLEEGKCLQVFRERIQARTGERRWYQETLYRESIKGVDKYVLVRSDRTNEQKGSLMLEQALDIARSSNEAKSPVPCEHVARHTHSYQRHRGHDEDRTGKRRGQREDSRLSRCHHRVVSSFAGAYKRRSGHVAHRKRADGASGASVRHR